MKKTCFCEGWMFASEGMENAEVILPHDATQLQPRSADAPTGSGGAYYHGGKYRYTKRFHAPAAWADRCVSLLFEGVYPSCEVLLNGAKIGGCAYGYSQFEVKLESLRIDRENELTVLVDHTHLPDSRWYAGGGIYRPVWLLEGGKSHIPDSGVRVTTLGFDPPTIRVETKHTGEGNVEVCVLSEGKTIACVEGENVIIELPGASLWDADHPALYDCVAVLKKNNQILDAAETRFGIRTLHWSAGGFFVNGRKTLLKGGCIHHDNGILGTRTFDEAEWRRIRILKQYGFNAIRSAHNPLSRAALEACDALGMYVMDEAWDMWTKAKTACDYAARFAHHWHDDLKAMADKDFNHPCVVMYSIGNEVTEPAAQEGVKLAKQLVEAMKALDSTRPVTAGINIMLLMMASMGIDLLSGGGGQQPDPATLSSTDFNEMIAQSGAQMAMAAATPQADQVSTPVFDLLDIAGYNYSHTRYENERQLHPERIVVGSETYPQDLPRNWRIIEKCPWVIGDFMWTAWDYLGEAGIGSWVYDETNRGFAKKYPWKLAEAGALDILGNETAEAGLAAVVWGARTAPYIAVRPVNRPSEKLSKAMWRGSNAIPSWSWQGCEGREATVEVYAKEGSAELFVNGRSVGCQPIQDCEAEFVTAYEPGELKAVVTSENGRKTESVLRSATGAVHINVTPENEAEPGKLLFVRVSLCGENGVIESNADRKLRLRVNGGSLLAFGSANPCTEESYLDGTCTTWYGQALAAVLVHDANISFAFE